MDYFLTRKFARDVDESEWLHTSVHNLETFLTAFMDGPTETLKAIGNEMADEDGLGPVHGKSGEKQHSSRTSHYSSALGSVERVSPVRSRSFSGASTLTA